MGRSDAAGKRGVVHEAFRSRSPYGLGSVVAVEDAYTRVQFDEHGVKKFLTSMSRLEPSSEPVPAGLRAAGKVRKKRTTKKAAAAPVAAVEE